MSDFKIPAILLFLISVAVSILMKLVAQKFHENEVEEELLRLQQERKFIVRSISGVPKFEPRAAG